MYQSIMSKAQLIQSVQSFFPKAQLVFLLDILFCTDQDEDVLQEEQNYYRQVLQSFRQVFETMPKTYETEPEESEEVDLASKVVHLHYFSPGCDWWIIEKDINEEQDQAYGIASLNGCYPEFGYIPISQLIDIPMVELDFHWEPKPLSQIETLKKAFKL